ncbi:MAG: sensor histidine kinase [Candidatus Xenobium sp.]|jgi:signal transduction histidine kinase|nr:HAMP domain-containing histidine kinase [Burkholderiales bacterium]
MTELPQALSSIQDFLAGLRPVMRADTLSLHLVLSQGLAQVAAVPPGGGLPEGFPRLCMQKGRNCQLSPSAPHAEGFLPSNLQAMAGVLLPEGLGVLCLGRKEELPFTSHEMELLEAHAQTLSWILKAAAQTERVQECQADLEEWELAGGPVADPGERNAASLSRMARQLGHDLRGPLANLRVALDLLRGADPEDQEPLLERLDAEIDRATRLISDRVFLTRALQPQLDQTSLSASARQVLLELRRPSDVRVELVAEEEARVPGDADLLTRMLLLLAENAVEALDEGGRIRLVVRRKSEGFELRVEDSGPGIPTELRARALRPGFTTRERGSGLGLAICERIARAHGGILRLEDSELGGAAAVVLLPPGPN